MPCAYAYSTDKRIMHVKSLLRHTEDALQTTISQRHCGQRCADVDASASFSQHPQTDADGSRLKIHGRGSLTQAWHPASWAHPPSPVSIIRRCYSAEWWRTRSPLYPSHIPPPWPCSAAAVVNCTAVCQAASHAQIDWTMDIRLRRQRLGCTVDCRCRMEMKTRAVKASCGIADWQRIPHSICLRTRSRTRICGRTMLILVHISAHKEISIENDKTSCGLIVIFPLF